jgi:hypothetical protein
MANKESDAIGERSLYVENLSASQNSPSFQKNESTAQENESTETTTKPEPICFYFKSGKAVLVSRNEAEKLTAIPAQSEEVRTDLYRNTQNNKQMEKLLARFATDSQVIHRITLIGRADDKQSKGGSYPSNYALSEARINVVRNKITDKLYTIKNRTWLNIDWITVPYSDEDPEKMDKNWAPETDPTNVPSSGCGNLGSDLESGRRVVEAYLTTVNRDSATKDEADIREVQKKEFFQKKHYKNPISWIICIFLFIQSQQRVMAILSPVRHIPNFLVSLENFFEVFFIVCFLNTLISLKRY